MCPPLAPLVTQYSTTRRTLLGLLDALEFGLGLGGAHARLFEQVEPVGRALRDQRQRFLDGRQHEVDDFPARSAYSTITTPPLSAPGRQRAGRGRRSLLLPPRQARPA